MTGTLETALENQKNYSDPDSMIYYAGIKEFIDGIVVAHTGYLIDAYSDKPDIDHEFWASDLEYNARRVMEYHKHGIHLHFHAVGDGGVRRAIDMYEAALAADGDTGSRMSIEHLDMSDPADWARMAKAGIICSVQPQHLALYPRPPTISKPSRRSLKTAAALSRLPKRNSASSQSALETAWPVSSVSSAPTR